MTKITIIGAGHVGAQAAFYCSLKKLGDIVLLDILEGIPQGKALDMFEAMPLIGSDHKVTGTNNYEDTKDSDIVVITAGVARKPGMSRDDLIDTNAKIMNSIIPEVIKNSPNCIIIVVSNPLDAMVYLAYKKSGFVKNRVIGMAGVLDSTRFRAFLAKETGKSVDDIEAMVLGGHGDLMVPLVDYCTIEGKPLSESLPKDEIDDIVNRVKNAGAEIVGLLKTGSAFFAPGVSITEMVEAIIKDTKKTLPCTVLLEGEYGVNGYFIGVPVKLGKQGVEEVVELKLNVKESEVFKKSLNHVKELVKRL